MSDPATNVTSAIVERIDQMVEDENLTTRTGLRLIISVFREGMVVVGGMDSRMRELEGAYVRFTNTMSAAKNVEENNQSLLREIVPTFKIVRWLGVTIGGLIVVLIWSIVTGKVELIWK